MTEPPDRRPAWELESTRRALRRHRLAGRGWLWAGVVLLVGATLTINYMELRSEELERTGKRAEGVVVDIHLGPLTGDGAIGVRFEAEGSVHEKQINLDGDSPRYAIGDKVEVIYDPRNLSNLRTTEAENPSGWLTAAAILLFVVGSLSTWVGWTMVRRARRWKRLLRTEPWRRVHSTYKELPGQSQRLLRLTEGDRTTVGAVAASARLRSLAGATKLWTVGELEGPAVIALSPDGPLFEFRRSRLRGRQTKWENAFTDEDA